MTKRKKCLPPHFQSGLCFDYRQNFGFAHSMFESGRLPDVTAFDCSGEWTWADKGRRKCAIKNSTHNHIIDACVSKSSGPRCEIVGRVSRRLSVHLSSCTYGFCFTPAPVQQCNAARAIIGYCDHGMRANLLGVSVAYDGIRTGHFGSRTDCLPDQHNFAPYSDMSR